MKIDTLIKISDTGAKVYGTYIDGSAKDNPK
jgi:hypothetical protein